MRRGFVVLLFIFFVTGKTFSTNITIDGFNISYGDKTSNTFELNENWRFAIGDKPEWAKPGFNDLKWDTAYFPFTIEALFPFHYQGNVWFRSTFKINEKQVGIPLAFIVKQFGASEIYIDGKLIHQFGKVGTSIATEEEFNPEYDPANFTLDSIGVHSIAIRYSNHSIKKNSLEAELEAFNLQIVEANVAKKLFLATSFKQNVLNATGIGIFLTLSIINFILFLFYKRDKANLFYSLFSAFVTSMFVINVIQYSLNSASGEILMDKLHAIFLLLSNLFLVALVYSFIYRKMRKRFWILLALTVLALLLIVIAFDWGEILKNSLNIYCIIEIIVIVSIAYFKEYDPSRKIRKRILFTLGALIAIACISLFINKTISLVIFLLLVSLIIIPIAGIIFIVPLYMTVRHAKSFAITNENLAEQLKQVKELSAKTLQQEQEKKKILETQNEKLEHMVIERTAELAEKNNEIKDSINYAKRIQRAILTSKKEINETLTNCFVLFKPKDIVSGDFYFYAKKETIALIAAADCTGHGVPGALMSMIGAEKLMGTVNESTNPSVILNLLNKGIKTSLRQSDHEESTRDGMDIALVSLDVTNRKALYAGANRPIWIIRHNTQEVEEIKATKKAIAGFTPDEQQFELHEIALHEGDTFYLFTDGFADQFGSNGKKLMTKKFRELLLSIQHLNMNEQETYLDNFIEQWKNGVEQVDDVLVIGVRV